MVSLSYQNVVLPAITLGMDVSVPLAKWLSKVIPKTPTRKNLSIFRALERPSIKLMIALSHLLYDETCSNNNLWSQFTNLYLFLLI